MRLVDSCTHNLTIKLRAHHRPHRRDSSLDPAYEFFPCHNGINPFDHFVALRSGYYIQLHAAQLLDAPNFPWTGIPNYSIVRLLLRGGDLILIAHTDVCIFMGSRKVKHKVDFTGASTNAIPLRNARKASVQPAAIILKLQQPSPLLNLEKVI